MAQRKTSLNKTSKTSLSKRLVSETALNQATKRIVDAEGKPTPAFQRAVLTALGVQHGAVRANLARLRKKYPDETPAQLADRLGTVYIRSLTGVGAAAGGTAVIPGVGTAATLGTSLAAALAFLEITGLYVQSVAELSGHHTKNDREAQALVMALMLGEDGRKMLAQAAGSSSTNFGTLGPTAMFVSGISGISEQLFDRLRKRFMRSLVAKQGAGLLGRLLPFGIGAVIGGWGNRKLGAEVIKSAQKTLGFLPDWDQLAELDRELQTRALPRAERKKHKQLGTSAWAADAEPDTTHDGKNSGKNDGTNDEGTTKRD